MQEEELDPRHLLIKIVEVLENLKIPYLITGGIALLIWGRPRFTADIDIVVKLEDKDFSLLKKSLKLLSKVGYISVENPLGEQSEFNFIDGNTGIKVDFWRLNKDDLFDNSRLKRRVSKKILGKDVYFTSPEDLILIKLKWYKDFKSSHQIEDVQSIIKISGSLDMIYLKRWAKKLGVIKEFGRMVRNSRL